MREYLRVLERYGSYLAKKIDEGKMFKVYDSDTLPSEETYDVLIDNSGNSKDIMVSLIRVDSSKSIDIDILKDVTVTNNGSALTVQPFVVGDSCTTETKVYKNPTYSGGTVIDGGLVSGNTGVRAIGGEEELFLVNKIRAGQKVVVKLTNLDSNNDALIKVKIVFYEVD